ncbi:hypothetical protein [Lutibacter sp.]|uniref:hypothetical protein n=1 Tax=Lutibacter sp. TaxID=1925666 RepID=UPI003567ED46
MHFKNESHQFVTSEEFAEYRGIKLEIVIDYLQKVSKIINLLIAMENKGLYKFLNA